MANFYGQFTSPAFQAVRAGWGVLATFNPPQYTPPPPPTPVPPTIERFVPLPGTPIYSNGVIAFDVLDDLNAFRIIVINARFASGEYEVVFDGTAFSAQYVSSFREYVTGGFHFALTREGGWPSAPTIVPIAIDTSGNQA